MYSKYSTMTTHVLLLCGHMLSMCQMSVVQVHKVHLLNVVFTAPGLVVKQVTQRYALEWQFIDVCASSLGHSQLLLLLAF